VTTNGTATNNSTSNSQLDSTQPQDSKNTNNLKPSMDTKHANKGHTAGFDAFMTGYIFAHYLCKFSSCLSDLRNKVYLSGKDMPLLLTKSQFTKNSKQHSDLKAVLTYQPPSLI